MRSIEIIKSDISRKTDEINAIGGSMFDDRVAANFSDARSKLRALEVELADAVAWHAKVNAPAKLKAERDAEAQRAAIVEELTERAAIEREAVDRVVNATLALKHAEHSLDVVIRGSATLAQRACELGRAAGTMSADFARIYLDPIARANRLVEESFVKRTGYPSSVYRADLNGGGGQ